MGRSSAAAIALALALLPLGCAEEKIGPNALHDAVELEDVARLEELLVGGFDPDTPDTEGLTALHIAAQRGYADIALKLLEYGASTRSRDKIGRTPMHLAPSGRVPRQIMIQMIEQGGDVMARDDMGRTPMHSDVTRHMAKLLLFHGVDVNARDNSGQTTLHAATAKHRGGTISVLIAAGAEVNAVDNRGQTALHISATDPSTALTFILLGEGAVITMVDNEGQTPLHIAADRGTRRSIEQLIAAGAPLDVKDKKGRTPADLARESGRRPAIKVFERLTIGPKRRARLERLGKLNASDTSRNRSRNGAAASEAKDAELKKSGGTGSNVKSSS